MLHHTGTDRTQLNMFPLSLDEMVDQDNPVRVIDLFVDRFDFVKLGFNHSITAEEGRPPRDGAQGDRSASRRQARRAREGSGAAEQGEGEHRVGVRPCAGPRQCHRRIRREGRAEGGEGSRPTVVLPYQTGTASRTS